MDEMQNVLLWDLVFGFFSTAAGIMALLEVNIFIYL